MIETTKTVRDIALEQPASIRVFERFGIDYCCGGRKPIEDACANKGLDVEKVLAALEEAAAGNQAPADDWAARSLTELSRHIVAAHHEYCRRELPRLAVLAARVVQRHGDTRSELVEIQAKLAALDAELTQHFTKEEMILFPAIAALEQKGIGHAQFARLDGPISVMMREHDAAGLLLAEMRDLSGEFTPPPGACPTYHAFYQGLREFEADLHQHIHLENNVLFPRALALAAQL
ncbi:MAG: iron-sulfur cluster repair di-iron protein [Acidobacteriota bacterium]